MKTHLNIIRCCGKFLCADKRNWISNRSKAGVFPTEEAEKIKASQKVRVVQIIKL